MKVEVLLSCMHQKNNDIVKRTNIQSDALIINQTNDNKIQNYIIDNKYNIRIISTTERGLSKSRNMALNKAMGDICLICDDDEILESDYAKIIVEAFERNKDIDVIIFKVKVSEGAYHSKKYKNKPYRINYLSALKVASWQIAFRRDVITSKNIKFNESIGSGVSKAGGEEIIFLHDCLRNKIKIQYEPINIGYVLQEESQWASHFFSKEYFYDRGIFTKQLYGGRIFATIYAVYFSIFKYSLYKNKTSYFVALKEMLRGIYC